jgi:hypothetical protein
MLHSLDYLGKNAQNCKLKQQTLSYAGSKEASAVHPRGRTIFIVDAHRDDGKRFVVRADEKLTAFVELEFGDSNVQMNLY